jgi:hypothetical protein
MLSSSGHAPTRSGKSPAAQLFWIVSPARSAIVRATRFERKNEFVV